MMLLRERKISLGDIARSLGVDVSSVSRVNKGTRRSRTIEREIARRLILSEEETFPEWHGQTRPEAQTHKGRPKGDGKRS